MRKMVLFALLLGACSAHAAGWNQLKSVCYSTLNTGHYDDMREEMKFCQKVVESLTLMQTDHIVIQATCQEAREGSYPGNCWGVKLTTKMMQIAD